MAVCLTMMSQRCLLLLPAARCPLPLPAECGTKDDAAGGLGLVGLVGWALRRAVGAAGRVFGRADPVSLPLPKGPVDLQHRQPPRQAVLEDLRLRDRWRVPVRSR